MTKKARRRKSKAHTGGKSGTNWYVIGGIAAGGIFLMAALLFLAVQEPEAPKVVSVAEYCDENPDNCAVKGNVNAAVTVVEVSDFGCGHCRNFNVDTSPTLEELFVDAGLVKYVALPYSLNPSTLIGASSAMCAGEQDSYFEFMAAMFSHFDDEDYLSRDSILAIGDEIGLDGDPFADCISSARYSNAVQENISVASSAGVGATPTFFINGEILEGAYPLEQFQAIINQHLGS